jgi:hypothetical protein
VIGSALYKGKINFEDTLKYQSFWIHFFCIIFSKYDKIPELVVLIWLNQTIIKIFDLILYCRPLIIFYLIKGIKFLKYIFKSLVINDFIIENIC